MADRALVYFLQDLNAYKIGITNNLEKRLKTLETGNPYVRLITQSKWMSRDDALWLENALHVKYAHSRVRGEWFDLNPQEVNKVMETLKGRKVVEPDLKHIPLWGVLAVLIIGSLLFSFVMITLMP